MSPSSRRALSLFAACLGPLLLAACATLNGLDTPPRVSLVRFEPVEIQLLEQRYLATVRIQNPNSVDLPISGMDYAISINDSQFADGVSNQQVTIPAYGEETLEVSVTSTLAGLLDQLQRFSTGDGKVRYRIAGKLAISGIPTGVPFEREGEVDLRIAPAARGRAI